MLDQQTYDFTQLMYKHFQEDLCEDNHVHDHPIKKEIEPIDNNPVTKDKMDKYNLNYDKW